MANVVHDSPPGQEMKEGATRTSAKRAQGGDKDGGAPPGTFRVHVFNRASDQWYEIQDLFVQETLPQLITISESCILIYEKKNAMANHRSKMGFD